jgi:hypothetical protein
MVNLTLLPESHWQKEQSVLFQFAQELKSYCRDEVHVLKDVEITGDLISVDAIVAFHEMPVAIIECVENEDYLAYVRRDIAKIMKRAQVQLGIVITSSGKYYLRKASRTKSASTKIATIAEEIQLVYRTIKEHLDPEEVKQTLLTLFDEAPSFENKKEIRPLFEAACNNLIIDHGRIFMQEKDEIAIMQMILGGALPVQSHICRYTSLDSLFKMIDSGKHAMCSPVSMNDKHECDYADSFMPWHVNRIRGEVEVEADNSYFLLSCSDIQEMDILTMWRLYGDNAKGVCLEYEVDSTKIDNQRYFIGRVNYGQKEVKKGQSNHPELSFMAKMQAVSISPGWYFSFAKWFIWKFFFKSWTYRDENEIRLIYVPNTSEDEEYERLHWYKDQSNGIFNRMALIPITLFANEDFPLRIVGITLGPQSPEAGRNREQIEYMVMDKGIDTASGFMVKESAIDNYR